MNSHSTNQPSTEQGNALWAGDFGTRSLRVARGFTLIELLVVIAIIGILAGLLFPAISAAQRHAKVARARSEIANLVAAIHHYETTYSRIPISNQAAAAANPDFTFGTRWVSNGNTINLTNKTQFKVPQIFNNGGNGYQAANNEVIAILMDLDKFPDGTLTANANHSRNPQKNRFFEAKMTGDTSSSGIGLDYVYRDPWGAPYIISLDVNSDNVTQDALYGLQDVGQPAGGGSAGLFGLVNSTDVNGGGNHFVANVSVMVWSYGPDGGAGNRDVLDLPIKANAGVNKDNILSWY